jgi:hypothetical protein
MADMHHGTKLSIQQLIDKYTPLHAHGVKLSLSYPSSGCLRITHKKPIKGTTRDFIEGLLLGAGLCPTYYSDIGPCGGMVPFIDWKGPDR